MGIRMTLGELAKTLREENSEWNHDSPVQVVCTAFDYYKQQPQPLSQREQEIMKNCCVIIINGRFHDKGAEAQQILNNLA